MRRQLSLLKKSLIASSDYVVHPIKFAKRVSLRNNAKRQIYIDCGANTGQVLISFLDKNNDLECHIFEPQPELENPLKQLIKDRADASITFYNKAVWIKNEPLDFYLATEWGDNFKGGSTLLSNHNQNLSKVDFEKPVQVNAIDFDEWFQDTIKPTKDDYIILKMDIEGAEYLVLEKMVQSKSISFVSELVIEFHHQMSEDVSEEQHNRLVQELNSQEQLRLIYWH